MNKLLIGIIAVVVIVVGVWWFNGGSSNVSLLTGSSVSPTPTATKSVVTKHSATPVPIATSTLSYSQLVAQYGSNRIQLDANCQAQPNSMVLKIGNSLLLDNRSNQTRNVVIDGRNYSLVGYGYQIITPTGAVPRVISISCNSSLGVGTIQLEANISGQ